MTFKEFSFAFNAAKKVKNYYFNINIVKNEIIKFNVFMKNYNYFGK